MVFSVFVKPETRAQFTEATFVQDGDAVADETTKGHLLPRTSGLSTNVDNDTTWKNTKDTVDNGTYRKPNKSSMWKVIWKYAVLHVLQITNVFLWYWTNGMNGIAMQSYSTQINRQLPTSSSTLQFLSMLSTSCFVTCQQLLLGAAIGRVLLLLLNSNIAWPKIQSTHWWPLSVLHGIGSLATNIGFMYGKASVIQVLKLLEPFETLLLSQICFRESNFSIGIVSSITVVVGAAMSLLNLQPKAPLPQAVIAALASGLTLSFRNVLQRKHHIFASTASPCTPIEGSTNFLSPSTTSPETSTTDLNKVEKSVVQFTQLSFYSGVWIGAASLLLWLLVPQQITSSRLSLPETSVSFQVLFWHPLYNVFSMITLGFCSAVTHSLLNSGKRVFAICLAMLWFRDGLNPPTFAGLFFVAVGGCWYVAETNLPQKESIRTKDSHDGHKIVIATAALGFLWWFQSLYR